MCLSICLRGWVGRRYKVAVQLKVIIITMCFSSVIYRRQVLAATSRTQVKKKIMYVCMYVPVSAGGGGSRSGWGGEEGRVEING